MLFNIYWIICELRENLISSNNPLDVKTNGSVETIGHQLSIIGYFEGFSRFIQVKVMCECNHH